MMMTVWPCCLLFFFRIKLRIPLGRVRTPKCPKVSHKEHTCMCFLFAFYLLPICFLFAFYLLSISMHSKTFPKANTQRVSPTKAKCQPVQLSDMWQHDASVCWFFPCPCDASVIPVIWCLFFASLCVCVPSLCVCVPSLCVCVPSLCVCVHQACV